MTTPPTGTSAANPPRRIGRYLVGDRLAGGGMGVVYKAVDEQLGRTVALKFLQSRYLADDSAAERFRREARTVAALDHPNICTVHEIGETENGGLYLAMPLYEGATVQERIASAGAAGLPYDEAVAIAIQVLRALGKAHGAGVVHRDVKPSNVFVTSDGIVKLLDFGIAKLADATMTSAGTLMGTVAYMSPEQARGDTVDLRTDLWAVGVVLYEMLSGKRPFPGDTPIVVLETIQFGSYLPLAEHRPDVPKELAAVVDRALQKPVEARYQTAQAFERDLIALGLATDISGSLMGRLATSGARRVARRSRRGVGIAVAAAAALVIGGAAWLLRGRVAADSSGAAHPAPSIVVLPFASIGGDTADAYFGDGLTEEVITRLAAVPELKVISRTSAMHYKGSTASLRQIADELHVANVLEGSIRPAGKGAVRIAVQLVDARDDRRVWGQSYDVAPRDPFRVQEDIARQVVRALELTLREGGQQQFARRGTLDPEALELYRRGRFHWERRTPEDHEKAVAYFERAIARDSSYADAWAGLADAYLTAYQLQYSKVPDSVASARQRAAAERALALDDQSPDAHVSVAISHWWRRDWPGAERELRRAISLNPGNVKAHYWLALLLGATAREPEALSEARLANTLDPFAIVTSINYAWGCQITGDLDCSIEQYGRALELNAAWTPAFSGRSVSYALAGRYDEAIRDAKAALASAPSDARQMATLAYAEARAGHRDEAGRALQQAEAATPGPTNPFNAYPQIARAWAALGARDSAFAWLERTDWTWPHRGTLSDPGLAPLREDPRFARLDARILHEMGMK